MTGIHLAGWWCAGCSAFNGSEREDLVCCQACGAVRQRLSSRPPGALSAPKTATVSPEDMWLLLLCTLRYAMGRATYIVSDAQRLVLEHRESLTAWQLAQIEREVRDELHRYESLDRTLGDLQDHRSWSRFADALVELGTEEP